LDRRSGKNGDGDTSFLTGDTPLEAVGGLSKNNWVMTKYAPQSILFSGRDHPRICPQPCRQCGLPENPGGADGKTAQFPDVAAPSWYEYSQAASVFWKRRAAGGIAAQRQMFLGRRCRARRDDLADLLEGVIDAGQVEHGCEVVLTLDCGTRFMRVLVTTCRRQAP